MIGSIDDENDEQCDIGVRVWQAGPIFLPSISPSANVPCCWITCDVLREVMKGVKLAHPFHTDAMVLLPDHLHALWTLPVDDRDYPMRWMLIKAGFSRQLPKGERRSEAALRKANGASGNGAIGST